MANHPKRTDPPGRLDPTAAELKRARERAGELSFGRTMTAKEFSAEIYTPLKTLENWEQDHRGSMSPATFELGLLKTGQFRVLGVQKPMGDERLPKLRLRTEDGRTVQLRIRPEELARLAGLAQKYFTRVVGKADQEP